MKIYDSKDIASFFIATANPEYGDIISNLKLQKLCYYAIGVMSAIRKDDSRPLFREPVQAWLHGPVIPEVYHKYKSFGSEAIHDDTPFDFSEISKNDTEVLNDVFCFYGQYSASKLRSMTHDESPWKNAYNRENKNISISELNEFFSKEIEQDYIDKYFKL